MELDCLCQQWSAGLLVSRCYVDEPNSCPDAKPSSWGAAYAWSCQVNNYLGVPLMPGHARPAEIGAVYHLLLFNLTRLGIHTEVSY